MKLALDAMGGDNAPDVNIDGAIETIKEYDDLLAEYGFFRVHQSHLVNINFIK